jgi:hypothetical protein
MNETKPWEVRIEWQHAPGVTWPQFSYSRRQTRQEAEDEASCAIAFGTTSAELSAVATFVRAPGDAEWQEVARKREASFVADAAENDSAATEGPT